MTSIQSTSSIGPPGTTTTSNTGATVQEYVIRVPKTSRKKYNVMRFNATMNVDFTKWSQVKMERENNMKEFKGIDEEQPKFGAGSEFGRDAREEARKKKLGYVARKYKPDDQPWILKAGGKNGKKFKGIREGGVSENAAYYVFTHAADGAIEAFPLQEWYNFQPIQRYKALSAEEAEQEFGKRNKVLNYFSLMLRKRLKGDEELDGEEVSDEMKGRKNASKKSKDLKISEMDEWMDSSDEESSENEKEKDETEVEDKKKKGKKIIDKKKKKRDTDAEAFEDSDDGDEEGRELDYISSSSESEPEAEKQLQGVAEEKALRKLLTSDEDSEDDENKSEKEESHEEENEDENKKNKEDKDEDKKKKKKKQKKKEVNKKKKDEKTKDWSDDFSSDSTDSENDVKKKQKETKKDEKEMNNSKIVQSNTKGSTQKQNTCGKLNAPSSRSASPTASLDNKRKLNNRSPDNPPVKKPKLELSSSSLSNYIPGSSESGITEDAVRRYLMRKPMTTIEILQKFKTKKTGLSSEQLVNIMTQILKKINPVKQTIKGKMYLSIKA